MQRWRITRTRALVLAAGTRGNARGGRQPAV